MGGEGGIYIKKNVNKMLTLPEKVIIKNKVKGPHFRKKLITV